MENEREIFFVDCCFIIVDCVCVRVWVYGCVSECDITYQKVFNL